MGILSEYPKMCVPPRKRFHHFKENQKPLNPNSSPLLPLSEPEPHTESDPEPSRKRTTPDFDVDHPEPRLSSSSSEPETPKPTPAPATAPLDDLFDALSPLDAPMQLFSEEEEQPQPLCMILPDQQFVLPDHQFQDGAAQEWTALYEKYADDSDGFLQRISSKVGDSSPTSSCWTRIDFNSSPTHDPDERFFTSPSSKFVGAGVENLGNTCFMSAVLQCFTHTVPLLQGLRSCDHNSPCDADGFFCAICAFRQHFDASLAPERSPVHPQIFVDNLNYFSTSFGQYMQEDAHEFMQCALDKLKGCFPPGADNIVEKIFGGRLISKLRCCSCGHTSDTYEPLIDLSLEIEDMCTLQYALESFTKVEKIDEKLKCSSCNEEVSMEKQLMLDETPLVAAFHLKRFKREENGVNKIVSPVYFTTDIDLRPYTSAKDTDKAHLNYELYAIIQHRGHSPNSGHYSCFIRSAPQKWYKMDDSVVTSVSEDVVLDKEAYILFYAREGTPWFLSIVEDEQCEKQNVGSSGCGEKKDAAGPSCNGDIDTGSTEAIDESASDTDVECCSAQTSTPPS